MIVSAASAQNKICNFKDGQIHSVYIFSDKTDYSMLELFGDTVPMVFINMQYVTDDIQKNEIDKKVKEGKIKGSVFIFPDNDPMLTKRFCDAEEYLLSLEK